MGHVEELPGANTQGDTLEGAQENLQEAAVADRDAVQIEAFFTAGATAKRGWGTL